MWGTKTLLGFRGCLGLEEEPENDRKSAGENGSRAIVEISRGFAWPWERGAYRDTHSDGRASEREPRESTQHWLVRRCLFEDRANYDERACPITNAAQALAGGSTGVASSHSGFKSAGFEAETGTVRTASGLTETAGDAGCILAEGVQQP